MYPTAWIYCVCSWSLRDCLGYFSTVTKLHDQGKLLKKEFIRAYGPRGLVHDYQGRERGNRQTGGGVALKQKLRTYIHNYEAKRDNWNSEGF